jgi:hypothetical protein
MKNWCLARCPFWQLTRAATIVEFGRENLSRGMRKTDQFRKKKVVR